MKHRRLTAAILALLMSVSLAACGDGSGTAADPASSAAAESSAETEGSTSGESTPEDSASGGSKTEDSVSGDSKPVNTAGTDSKAEAGSGDSKAEESAAGDESSKTDENSGSESPKSESSKSEDSKSESSKSESSTGQGVSGKSDLAAAQKCLEGLLSGVINKDRSKILASTNIGDAVGFYRAFAEMIYNGVGEESLPEMTDDEILEEMLNELMEDDVSAKSYRIVRSAENTAFCKEYNEGIDKAIKELDEAVNAGEYQQELSDVFRKLYTKIDRLYAFEVEMTDTDGEKNTEVLYVTQRGAKMNVDMMLASSLIGYVSKSRVSSANSAAKTVFNAFTAALTDADTVVSVTDLNGTYSYKGSDFANLQPVKLDENAVKGVKLAYVKYQVTKYFEDITELEEIRLTVKDGCVVAAAVRKGGIEDPVTGEKGEAYGTYPQLMTEDALKTVKTIDQALQYAQNKK